MASQAARRGRLSAHVGPLGTLALFSTLDMALGPDRVVLGLVVITPLLAATSLGRRATVAYAAAALVAAALLGIFDQQYTDRAWPGQAIRLFGVAMGGALAVAACGGRLTHERRMALLSARAATEGQRARDAERMVGLARALGDAESEAGVLDVVQVQGARLLGARGAAIGVLGDEASGHGSLQVLSSRFRAADHEGELDLPDGVRSALHAVAAGAAPEHLPARADVLRRHPDCADFCERTGTHAAVVLPLRLDDLDAALWLSWPEPRAFGRSDLELLEAFAAQCAQALARVRAHAREQVAYEQVHRLAETLQRSLLTEPPRVPHLELAVRYLPAAEQAQVGGDWYDAFLLPDTTTVLVIGDVTGHDGAAAATMAQVRNVLRGVAQSVLEPPATVLRALDRSLSHLAVDSLATAVLLTVEPPDAAAHPGARGLVVRWSNAGHPPPVLLRADGSTALLDTVPDLLLGLDPTTARTDHEHRLGEGDTVLLYTDGLVERRGVSIDTGLGWLCRRAADLSHLPLEKLCDALLAELAEAGGTEDDVALLALRAHPGGGTGV